MARAHIENDPAFNTSGLPHQGQITSGRLRALAGAGPCFAGSLGLIVDWLALSRERLILDLDTRTFLRCEGLSRGQVGAFGEFGHVQIYWNRDLRMPGWQIELVWRDPAIRSCRVLERSFECGEMDTGHRWAQAWAEALADRVGVDVRDDPGASEYLPGPDATLAALTARACESARSHDPRTLPLLRQALDPGETVLWAGPPDPWSRAEPRWVAFLGRCIALLAAPSLVSLIFWEHSPVGCLAGTAYGLSFLLVPRPRRLLLFAVLLFMSLILGTVVAVPVVLDGLSQLPQYRHLSIAGLLFLVSVVVVIVIPPLGRRRYIVYAITSQRFVVVEGFECEGTVQPLTESFGPGEVNLLKVLHGRNGWGSLAFKEELDPDGRPYFPQHYTGLFNDIPRVQEVADVAKQAMRHWQVRVRYIDC